MMKMASTVLGGLLLVVAVVRPFAAEPSPRLALELVDYAALPVTADNTNENTRAQLVRVDYLRDAPGDRFFVNDLNGPLSILDKQIGGSPVHGIERTAGVKHDPSHGNRHRNHPARRCVC